MKKSKIFGMNNKIFFIKKDISHSGDVQSCSIYNVDVNIDNNKIYIEKNYMDNTNSFSPDEVGLIKAYKNIKDFDLLLVLNNGIGDYNSIVKYDNLLNNGFSIFEFELDDFKQKKEFVDFGFEKRIEINETMELTIKYSWSFNSLNDNDKPLLLESLINSIRRDIKLRNTGI
jgi:hypothetical protein